MRAIGGKEMIYDVIKTYGKGKGEDTMWKSVKMLSDALDGMLSAEEYAKIERKIYESISGGHYNEEFAHEDVSKMYYINGNGERVNAPYWTDEQVRAVYNNVKSDLPSQYNMWDFYVTLNMTKADNCNLYNKWWQGANSDVIEQKMVETAVNYLNDVDSPHGTEKIWSYING